MTLSNHQPNSHHHKSQNRPAFYQAWKRCLQSWSLHKADHAPVPVTGMAREEPELQSAQWYFSTVKGIWIPTLALSPSLMIVNQQMQLLWLHRDQDCWVRKCHPYTVIVKGINAFLSLRLAKSLIGKHGNEKAGWTWFLVPLFRPFLYPSYSIILQWSLPLKKDYVKMFSTYSTDLLPG